MQYIIAYDNYSVKEINEIEQIFKPHNVAKKSLVQFDLEASAAIIITLMLGKLIITGIGNSIGHDVWEKLKLKFSNSSKSKDSTIELHLQSDTQQIRLNIIAKDSNTIKKAFDTADSAVQKIEPNVTNITLFFDPQTQQWQYIERQEFIRKLTISAASTNVITKKNRKFKFTKESLENSTKTSIGLPVMLGHGGKQIGEVTKAWVDGEVLYHEIGIYDGIPAKDIEELEKILRSGGGPSMGLTYDQSNNSRD